VPLGGRYSAVIISISHPNHAPRTWKTSTYSISGRRSLCKLLVCQWKTLGLVILPVCHVSLDSQVNKRASVVRAASGKVSPESQFQRRVDRL